MTTLVSLNVTLFALSRDVGGIEDVTMRMKQAEYKEKGACELKEGRGGETKI